MVRQKTEAIDRRDAIVDAGASRDAARRVLRVETETETIRRCARPHGIPLEVVRGIAAVDARAVLKTCCWLASRSSVA
jgi:hypothetical protein